jgi:hypothetical protein
MCTVLCCPLIRLVAARQCTVTHFWHPRVCALADPVVLCLLLLSQVFKFAQYIGAKSLAGRHTPGTFTNQIQKQFEEPRLLILTGAQLPGTFSNNRSVAASPTFRRWHCQQHQQLAGSISGSRRLLSYGCGCCSHPCSGGSSSSSNSSCASWYLYGQQPIRLPGAVPPSLAL